MDHFTPGGSNSYEEIKMQDKKKFPTTEQEVEELLKKTNPEKWKEVLNEWWKQREAEYLKRPDTDMASIDLNLERARFYGNLYKSGTGESFLDAMYENYEAALNQTNNEDKKEKRQSILDEMDTKENELFGKKE